MEIKNKNEELDKLYDQIITSETEKARQNRVRKEQKEKRKSKVEKITSEWLLHIIIGFILFVLLK